MEEGNLIETEVVKVRAMGDEIENREKGAGSILMILSRAISCLMHPLLLTFYVIVLLFYGNSIAILIPEQVKLYFLGVVLFYTAIAPGLLIFIVENIWRNRLDGSKGLRYEPQKLFLLIITAFFYGVCLYATPDLFYFLLVKQILWAAISCIILGAVVRLRWRISLYMLAAGAALVMMFMLNYRGVGQFFFSILTAILLVGVLGSARAYIGRESMAELGVGFMMGVVVSCVVFLFVQ